MDARATPAELWLIELESCAEGLVELNGLRSNGFEFEQRASDQTAHRAKQLAHSALRLVLMRYMGPTPARRRFERTPSGKPILSTPPGERPFAFSLAHTPTHALVGCMFGAHMGVDLEHPRPIMMTSARRTIIECAAAKLSQEPLPPTGEPRTLQAWVRLEALAKADGSGIGQLLTRIGAVGGAKPADATAAAHAQAKLLHLSVHDLPLGRDLYAAIALDQQGGLSPVKILPAHPTAMRTALGLEH